MAFGKSKGFNAKNMEGIIEMNIQLNAKVNALTEEVNKNSAKLDAVAAKLENNACASINQLTETYISLHDDYSSLRRELKFIATQNEQIFLELTSQIRQLASAITEVCATQSKTATPAPAQIDYDELAKKVAAILPAQEHVSPDAIASKVAEQMSCAQKEFDILVDEEGCSSISESIAKKLRAEKLVTAEDSGDYEIVIDEDGLNSITERVIGELRKSTDSRFEGVEGQLTEIKQLLLNGAARQTEISDQSFGQYVADEPALFTVSEVTQDEPENSVSEEFAEEIAELVEELDEIPVAGEIEEIEEASGGVDFENMMKYNRSFIARIIQSTDEQKEYYGRVKTALLSYAKVNSNVAWGAERFNKGRETIARFKIRGKTLCLYLALDPKEFEYSVYHHIDVSDNKSMHGTPMMIKIKSPRGAKKAIRLIDEMLERRGGVKRAKFTERNYAAMYPYESMEELIEDGLVKDVGKNK